MNRHVFPGSEEWHFSINVVNDGIEVQTHQTRTTGIINGENVNFTQVQYVTIEQLNAGGVISYSSLPIPLNGNAAQAFQHSEVVNSISGFRPPYDQYTNSCVTHVTDVLRAGGYPVDSGDIFSLYEMTKCNNN